MTDKQLKAVAMPGDFIFHTSWFEIFKSFDMATAYAIFMAMLAYVQSGAIPAEEELRRLTVFLFAHIDTDRERLLSLQPKRRSSTKKKAAEENPATDSPSPEPQTTPKQSEDTAVPQPTPAPESPAQPQVTHPSHNSHNSHLPQTRASRRARLSAYAQKVSAAIRRGELLSDPKRVHKRNFKKRFKKSIPVKKRILFRGKDKLC